MAVFPCFMIKTYFFCVIFLIHYVPVTVSVTYAAALLKLKQSFTNAEALNSWKIGTDPCDKNNRWLGVICQNQIVRGVLLGGLNLSGSIDVEALAELPGLRTLSFRSNLFSGPIPEFNRMSALKGLYLSANQFSGDIPSNYFEKMEGVKKIWLSGNKFSGEIPSSITLLRHLIELHIENNQFSGAIPDLDQSTLMSLDVSNNNLTGKIPNTLSRFNASSFKGNSELCGEKVDKACGADPAPGVAPGDETSTNNGKKSISIGIWVLIGSMILLLVMVIAIFIMCRRQKGDRNCPELEKQGFPEPSLGRAISSDSKKSFELSRRGSSIRRGSSNGKKLGDLSMVNDDKGEFGLADLMKASAEVLGNGPLGSSYKAMMANGLTVVVKRIKEMNKIGKDGFDAEVKRLGRLRHKNILTLLAYHYRKEEKLFVYEYIPKGSLLYLLHGDRGLGHAELTWPVRLKILQGIAEGLNYLHTELSSSDLPHGDLKSGNILINTNYEPMLTGYGFHSLINNTHAAQALIAFKSPEAVQNQQVSPKSDVYCLGIVILEMLTGKYPSQYLSNKGGIDIVQWTKSAIAEGRESDLFDPDIGRDKSLTTQMKEVLQIGAECIATNPEQRISVREVIRRIEEIQQQHVMQNRIQIMPSLRDGCTEIPMSQSHQESPIN